MKPLSSFSLQQRKAIKVVFTDIDDTLTTAGLLTADAYTAMQSLKQHNIAVVPITGRPAGWCDHIARMWPVDGVVGENGAFYFCYDQLNKRMIRQYVDSAETRETNRQRLNTLAKQILAAVPGCAISADQTYREADLAIDFCEDVAALGDVDVEQIVSLFEQAGATAKISSIHVNGWFGVYDKLSMTRIFADECLNMDIETEKDHCVFVGDSPNDSPMFDFFPQSIGVANIAAFIDRLPAQPTYITASEGGTGFAEVATLLLEGRLT